MKVKNSIRKKILPSLLIATTLGGVTNTTAFALDNLKDTNSVSEVSMMSKEESQKILDQMSRTRGIVEEYKVGNTDYVLIKYGGYLYLFDYNTRQLITGLVTLGGDTYYFSKRDGTAQKGWYNVKDSRDKNGRYYFDPGTCTALKNGIYTLDNYRYIFKDDGRIQTGLGKVRGYIYNTNYKGEIVTGWQTINGGRYFFDPMLNGAARTGWYIDGNAGKMYFNSDRSMASGVTKIGSETYLFKSHGNGKNCYVTTGFFTDNSTGNRYLFDGPHGEAHKGWYKNLYAATNSAQGWMYFDGLTEVMANGWKEINGKKYLFKTSTGSYDAYPFTGWYNDGYYGYGNTYYFDIENNHGAAVSGINVIDGVEYLFNNEGILLGNGDKNPIA